MLENRPIVAITIGYIIGIIMGLYFKKSIVLLYFLIFIIYLIFKKPPTKKFKLISYRRYFRYVKLVLTKKVVIIILVSSIISNSITLYKNAKCNNFENKMDGQEMQIKAKVISNGNAKKYKKIYVVKFQKKKFYINVSKNTNLDYGNIIKLKGTYIKPNTRTNYKGFDYEEYLKTKRIYGTINCKEIFVINKNKSLFNQMFLKIKNTIQNNFDKEISNVLLGMILGYTDEIDETIKESFSKSNISHILAVSGMHIGYIVLFCSILFDKLIGKKISKFISILILLLYICIIGFSPSAVRAIIMALLVLSAKLFYRKSDVWTNLGLSLLSLLIYNPFLIKNVGLLLSFVATVGILIYSKNLRFKNKIYNAIGITISASIFILPILAIYFNKISVLSLAVSVVVGVIAGPIFFLGIIYILLSSIFKLNILLNSIFKLNILLSSIFRLNVLKNILNLLVKLLLIFAKIGSKIPFNQMYVVTPSAFEIFTYYLCTFIILFLVSIYKPKRKQNKVFNKRIKNLISLAKYEFRKNKNKVISIFLIFAIIITMVNFIPSNLKIFFIDVGQGDSCLIVTPNNKKILIDGGGSESYDVGKNVLVPYLLARRIKHLDYAIISHFDTDHIGGILTVMQELKVKNVVISKQAEISENYKKFIKIGNEKHIKVIVVGQGDRLYIEKNLYFDILWPNPLKLIQENALNNNSIVCKLHYKNFSMIFTGDVEEIAEKQILQEYRENLQILSSNILKVAHHGSKSSSSQDFINAVKPNVALIGVGENNAFGHPNDGVIERLENLRYKSVQN